MLFQMEIALGNEAMQEASDVATALAALSNKLHLEGWQDRTGSIRDANGNTVGTWWVEDD